MTPRYTTYESLQRKLRARLNLSNNGFGNPLQGASLAQNTVEDELLQEVIEESEDFMDSYLRLVYALPLKYPHTIIKRAVDALAIADLLEIHFPHLGMDSSQGASAMYRQRAYDTIKSLTYPLVIYLPGGFLEPKMGLPVQAIILPGEEQLSGYRDNVATNSTTIIGKRTLDETGYGINFGVDYDPPMFGGRESPYFYG